MANPVHEDDRKLFVGALPQEAKDSDIKEYFGQFGEIENINLKMDPMTGRSRYGTAYCILPSFMQRFGSRMAILFQFII
jgi:RNA recognition motif-containing protein